MKKIFAVFALAILLMSCLFMGFAHELSPTNEFFVNDFANVLSDDTEAEILAVGRTLDEKTTAQLVLVTVDTIGQNDIFNYSLELARDWGIGSAKSNNGCLIFISIGDRKAFVQVGYGLEGCLTDGKTGELQADFLVPYMKNGENDLAAINIYNAVAEVIYKEYGMSLPEDVKAAKKPSRLNEEIISTFVAAIAVAVFLIYALMARKKKYGTWFSYDYDGDDSDSGSSDSGGGGDFGGGGSGSSW